MTTENANAETTSDQGDKGQETAVDAKIDAATGNGADNGDQTPQFTQTQVDEIVKKRLDRERTKAQKEREKLERQQQEAQEAAAADALSKSGEFEKLAQQRASQLAQTKQKLELAQASLEQEQTAVARYRKVIEKTVAAQLESIPEQYKPLLSKLDIIDQFDWLAENAANVTNQKSVFAIPATPKAAGPGIVTNGGVNAPKEQAAAIARRYRSKF